MSTATEPVQPEPTVSSQPAVAATTNSGIPRFDEVIERPDDALEAFSYFPPSEENMKGLIDQLFVNNWAHIVVGPCMEGAVFEVQFAEAPKVSIFDGYLTVDLGKWHFHICVGAHKGSSSEELRRMRPVAKIGFFERRGKGCAGGRSWGLRMWNGYGEQMTTVFLPNPRLTDDMQILKTPDWSRLDLYYRLRQQFLGEPLPSDYEIAANLPFPETKAAKSA
jgi:hypothetical protein